MNNFLTWARKESHLPLWLLGTLLVIFLLRIPTFFEPYWYGDEGITLTLGNAVRHGLILYRDIHDNKPPLLYLTAAVAGNLFWLRVILAFWNMATIIFFWKLTRRLWANNQKTGRLATIVFALLTTLPLVEGNIANGEIFMIGPTILAFWLLLREDLKPLHIVQAGLLFGIATLFKIPALFDAGTIIVIWAGTLLWRRKALFLKNLALLAVGVALPLAATSLYFWWHQALTDYLTAILVQNIGYLSSWRAGWTTVTLLNNPLVGRAAVAASVLIALLVFHQRRIISFPVWFAATWATIALFAVVLSERPYPHYLLQLVPALSLLVGIVTNTKSREQFVPYPFFVLIAAVLVFYKFYYYPVVSYYQNFLSWVTRQQDRQSYFAHFDPRTRRTYNIARFLAQSAQAEDRIFVWGDDAEIYALSKLLPATRYFVAYHIRDFQAWDQTIQTLMANPPHYIITTQPINQFPQLSMVLNLYYTPIQQVDGETIWLRINNKHQL